MIETRATGCDLLAAESPMRGIARAIALGRIGLPVEVARCPLFLASANALYVPGLRTAR